MPCRFAALSACCFLFAVFLSVSHSCPIGYVGSPCTVRRCESLIAPANGIIVGQCLREYSSVCRMQCYEGYVAVGSVERRCDVSPSNVMVWTGSPLQCIVRRCESLLPPPNGVIVGQCPRVILSVCRMQCYAGYLAVGSEERKCDLTANNLMEWTGSPLQCVARRCEFLFPPANGIIVGQCLTEYSSVCRMQCYEGYEAVGSVERKCDVSANNVMEWTGSPLQCVVIRCPALSVAFAHPPSGVCTSPSLQYNTRCTFTCQAGYSLKGCKERVCQLDKSWSGNPTSCVVTRCPALSVAFAHPPSGVCTSPSLQYNTRCTFTCQAGYSLKGSKERVCQLDKSWSGNPTSCVG